MSTKHDSPTTSGDAEQKKTLRGIIYLIPILFVGFLLIKFIVFSNTKRDGDENIDRNEERSSEKPTYKYVVTKRVPRKLGKEYGQTVYILSIEGFNFEGATQPYRVINKDGEYADGAIGQDVSGQLPKDSRGNSELRFISLGEESGTITVVISEPK